MADEDDLELADEEGGGKSSKMKLILLIVVGLGLVGGSVGATLFLTGALDKADSAVASEAEVEKTPEKKEAIYVDMDPKFTVNFEGQGKTRFLQLSIQALTRNEEVEDAIKKHMPMIRNNLVMLFSGQDAAGLKTPEGREKLRAQSLAAIQEIVEQERVDGEVESIFFTSFVMQ